MDARKPSGGPISQRGIAPLEPHSDSELPILSAEQVFHDYAPRVYSMARRMVASDVDAEDVTQDVLLQVVRKLPTFRGESAFPTWLHRVTVNAALTHRRRQAVRQELRFGQSAVLGGDEPIEATDPLLPPDDQLVTHERRELLERAIQALPEAYRLVFVLSEVEGVPNAQIADRLDMSLAAIKSRLHRARAMLRDMLSPHFDVQR